jgi:hypothetical protein
MNKNYIYIQNCIVMLHNKYHTCYATACHVVDNGGGDNDNLCLYY